MAPEVTDRISHQLRGWRESLIDLTKRQKLLYFKHLRVGTLEIGVDSIEELFAMLSTSTAVLTPGKREDGSVVEPRGGDTLYCPTATEKAIQSAGTALTNKARDVSTGQGVWPLHLGLGMLHWVDPDTGDKAESPILMVPVDLSRDGVGKPWKVTIRDEEVQFNPALRLKLRDFGISVTDDDEADSPLDLVSAVEANLPTGWELRNRAVLANFSFPKLAMFYDLRDNEQQIMSHPLVQMLAVGPDAPLAREFPFEPRPFSTLETYRPLGSSMSILDADSSQRQCVAAALDGQSFVMDGPPGTGKSQTISNVIAELIAVGKSVLFVSEKVAALEVVEGRLDSSGLGHMVLNLHGERTRKEVAQHLAETLTTSVSAYSRMSSSQLEALGDSIGELTEFATAMNEVREPLGMSLITAIGEVDRRIRGRAIPPLDAPVDVDRLSDKDLRKAEGIAKRYAESQTEYSRLRDPVWTGLESSTHSRNEINHAKLNADQAVEALNAVLAAASTIEEDFDLAPAQSIEELTRRLALADLMREPRRVPFPWFSTEMTSIAGRLDRVLELRAATIDEAAELDANLDRSWRWCDASRHLDELATALAPLGSSPWTASSALAAAAALDSCGTAFAAMEEGLDVLARAFGLGTVSVTAAQVTQLVDLANLVALPHRPPSSWFDPARLPQIASAVSAIEDALEAVQRAEASATEFFQPSIRDEDATALAQRFAGHKGSIWSAAGRADRKLIKEHAVGGKFSKQLIEQLPNVVEWESAIRKLTVECDKATHVLGFAPDPTPESIAVYKSALELVSTAVQTAGLTIPLSSVAVQLASDGSPSPTLLPAARAVQEQQAAIQSSLTASGVSGLLGDRDTLPVEDIAQRVRQTADSLRVAATAIDNASSVLSPDGSIADSSNLLAWLSLISDHTVREAELTAELNSLGLSDALGLDRDELLADLQWGTSVRDALGRDLDAQDYEALYRTPRFSSSVNDALAAYHSAVNDFLTMFDARRRSQLESELSGTPGQCLDLLLHASNEALTTIPLVDSLIQSRSFIDDRGLGRVADFCISEHLEATEFADFLVGALLDSWIDQVSLSDTRLERWRAFERNQLVSTFASLDQQLVSSAQSRIVRAYNDRVRGAGHQPGAQIIVRESEKKTRHLPIRQLLDRSTDVVQTIKPCMMMSPLTVSNYVPSTMKFDVVVFDEASQVKPEDAVNCIYRGRQLIVAGDQKQLPPTSFFAAGDDEGDEELDDFESVLDSAKAAGLTALPLTWHYRSRHESLIAFSNKAFYEGRLFTFPSATYEADDLGVSFHHAHGAYRRGTSRDNPTEAAKVAERVQFFAENFPELSIGVVTMSESQRTAVQGALERLAGESPAVARLLNSGAGIDDFFVKALENVQGDERDVIIMTIGYGPEDNGKFSMNFGPLNKKGGWRRLNVAITRARRRLEVVASFEHGQLNPGQNETLRHLRRFLNYAQNGPNVLEIDSEDSLGGTESVFEEQVLSQIESWGYDVVTQVGVAGYRIDMAVRHPDRPGTYALGIECDGAAYHSAPTARDRDRLRHAVLEGLGWRLHRIWGLSWWRDRENQVDALKAAIEKAIADSAPTHEVHVTSVGGSAALNAAELDFGSADEDGKPDTESPTNSYTDEAIPGEVLPSWVQPYQRASITPAVGGGDILKTFMAALLEEAPVSEGRMLDILKASLGVARVNAEQQAQFRAEIERDTRFSIDNRGFVRAVGKPVHFFRKPDSTGGRTVVPEISDPELTYAIRQLVGEYLIIDRERLVEELVHIAGDPHVTRPARRIIENVIEQCHLEGSITIDDDGTIS